MIEADELLATRLQAEEQEKYSIEEKSRMLVEMIDERKKFFAAQRAAKQTSKPPTKAQMRNRMYKVKGSRKKSICRKRARGKYDDKSVKKAEIKQESSSKRVGDEIESDKSKKQKVDEHVEAKKDDDQEEAEMKMHIEIVKDDEVAIDAIPLATKPPMIVEYKIDKEGNMGYFKLIRADGSSKRYSLMIKMLQDINREDLETLWKLVNAKHGNTRPEEYYERVLWGDLKLGNVIILRVYYVEGLGHNLFSIGQFCDADLEVAFRKNACFIQNLEGVDPLLSSRDTNLYIISLDDMLKTSPIYLLSKASKTKSWLWHHRLSHLNFGTLNKLAKDGLARGIPKLKFQKDHLCSACALGKSKKSSQQPKAKETNQEKLYLLLMDLCGPMRVESINRKKYILVIVDDYSRFTWVKFLGSNDETPDAIIKCIKNIQIRLNATVRNDKIDNGTEFVNQTLRDFYENVSISHRTSVTRTTQ
ncbi:retrovirus-related pol polyprotein from transposon TNT 1-94 [Tanacetum coccineum]